LRDLLDCAYLFGLMVGYEIWGACQGVSFHLGIRRMLQGALPCGEISLMVLDNVRQSSETNIGKHQDSPLSHFSLSARFH
jgi:hypothetical protein